MKSYISNNVGVAIAVLLFLILIVLISGFGYWNYVFIFLCLILLGIVLFSIVKLLNSILRLSSFAFTHTTNGEPRIKTRWSTAFVTLYKQQRGLFIISFISLLLMFLVLVKYLATGKWG
jgi:ABC-type branched-subunit amino acid transport system permease subunit